MCIRDRLHIVPERRQPTGSRRIWATHPPVDDRVAALREMERELQSARFSADMSADLQVPHRGLTREGSYALAGKRTVAG